MIIERVDLFYLAIPKVLDIGDGSQDAILVRVLAGDHVGWGQAEASPLTTMAAFCCPMSHSACRNVGDSLVGESVSSPLDIIRINQSIRNRCFDLLQASHALAGIDIALWDLLGRYLGEPVWKLLGHVKTFPKVPYASRLFGDTADETFQRAREIKNMGFSAAKFGWGGYGIGSVESDGAHIHAARKGLGQDINLMVDAGTVWGTDVSRASERLPALRECGIVWLEEPFHAGALSAYHHLARMSASVTLAGGEGAYNFEMARNLIDLGGIGFVQIDAGRMGITSAHEVACYAEKKGIQFVNHTFTTMLSLSASLQPFVHLEDHKFCEFPVAPSEMAQCLTDETIEIIDGLVNVPEGPGLGLTPNLEVIRKYLIEVEIRINSSVLYTSSRECL